MFREKEITAKQAFWLMLLCFALTPVLFFILLDNFFIGGGSTAFPLHPKQFFLEKVPGKRVIFASGSNTHFGVKARMLEDYFHAPVGNHARSGGMSLEGRLYTLLKYTHPGDVVILPLEWHYYAIDNSLSEVAVTEIVNNNFKYYYEDLPLKKRLKFAFTDISLSALGRGLGGWQVGAHFLPKAAYEYALNHIMKDLMNDRGGNGMVERVFNPKHEMMTAKINCWKTTFLNQEKKNFAVSDGFRSNLKIMQEIQNKGVKVILTFPATVTKNDTPCYPKEKELVLQNYVKALKNLAKQHGVMMIGDPKDSSFSKQHYRDSTYHIRPKASIIRTKKLITTLQAEGIGPLNPEPVDVDQILLDLQSSYLKE